MTAQQAIDFLKNYPPETRLLLYDSDHDVYGHVQFFEQVINKYDKSRFHIDPSSFKLDEKVLVI